MKRIPFNCGGEQDYLTRWRRYLCNRTKRNQSSYTKRKYRRRERGIARVATRNAVDETSE